MWQVIGVIGTLVAAAVTILYTLETRKARLQQIRPKLVFLTREHQATYMEEPASVDLFVRNIGTGDAINIQLERGEHEGFKFKFEPEYIAILEGGEERQLSMRPAEGSNRPDITTILGSSSVSQKLVATYSGVEHRNFCTSTTLGAGAEPPFIREE